MIQNRKLLVRRVTSQLPSPTVLKHISYRLRGALVAGIDTKTEMLLFRTLVFSILFLAGLLDAKSSVGDSVLIVLEPSLHKDKFSIFFNGLEGAL